MSERSVEIPKLLEFVDKYERHWASLLDVGCHNSGNYASEIQKYGFWYDGIDILESGNELKYLQSRFIGNFEKFNFPLDGYDAVISISAIEHAGVSTYKVNHPDVSRSNIVQKMAKLAHRDIFITFPVGVGKHLGEFECIEFWEIRRFQILLKENGFTSEIDYFYAEFPNGPKENWERINFDEAFNTIYDPTKGVQAVCIFKGTKK